MYHYLDLSMMIVMLDYGDDRVTNLSHFRVAISSEPLREDRVTTVLNVTTVLLALGLKLAHQVVGAEFGSLDVRLCVIDEEKVLVLGVGFNPVAELGLSHESVIGLG